LRAGTMVSKMPSQEQVSSQIRILKNTIEQFELSPDIATYFIIPFAVGIGL
jgi:hypothetical protein